MLIQRIRIFVLLLNFENIYLTNLGIFQIAVILKCFHTINASAIVMVVDIAL